MKMKNIIIFLIIVGVVSSCVELIDIDVDTAPSRLVIFGEFSTEAKPHSIRITRTAGYFTTNSPAGVSGAIVSISDEDGNIFYLSESKDAPGLYQTADNVRGEEGKTYTLNVQVETQHYSATALMPHINDISSVELKVSSISENVVEVLVYMDTEDLPEDNLYLIFVSTNDSLLNSTIDRYRVMSNIREGMPCFILRQNVEDDDVRNLVRIGDKVTVNINAISSEYADFVRAAQSEIRGSNPIFGGPPANVPTNIKSDNPVLGFFTAFSSRFAEVVYE